MALKSADTPWTFRQRMAGGEKVGEHKTSVLEDFGGQAPLEFNERRVVELVERRNPPMQNRRTVYSCRKLLAQRSVPLSTAPK